MTTITDIYRAIIRDKDLRQEFIDAVMEARQEEFFAAQGCKASAEDICDFFEGETVVIIACEALSGALTAHN